MNDVEVSPNFLFRVQNFGCYLQYFLFAQPAVRALVFDPGQPSVSQPAPAQPQPSPAPAQPSPAQPILCDPGQLTFAVIYWCAYFLAVGVFTMCPLCLHLSVSGALVFTGASDARVTKCLGSFLGAPLSIWNLHRVRSITTFIIHITG